MAVNAEKIRKMLAALVGLLALSYLLNPGAGLFEAIPDNLPLLGNLDEATAVTLLLTALRIWGLDLTDWLPERKQPPQR